jgi:ubiquitin-like 1-activating enzyme E1 B
MGRVFLIPTFVEMAGNIIPAIATTNAIVSGLIVLQALQLLRKSYDKLRNVFVQTSLHIPLYSSAIQRPSPFCGVCRDTYTQVLCDPSKTKLEEIVKGVMGEDERDVSVFEDKRLLSDPDWDDNNERTLESLNVTRGKFLSVVDDNEELETINIAIVALP